MDSPGFLDIFRSGYSAAMDSAAQWDKIWTATFGFDPDSPIAGGLLFSYLSYMGLIIATGCLILVAISNVKLLGEGNYFQFFMNIGMSLIVVIFLSHGGQLMAKTCYAGRDIILNINEQMLSFVVDGLDLQDAFRQLQELQGAKVAVSDYLQQCEYLTGEEQQNCIQEVVVTVNKEIEDLKASAPLTNQWVDFAKSFVLAFPPPGFDPSLTDDPDAKSNGKVGNFLLPTWENIVFSIMGAFMRGYQSSLEISLILTAVVSPIAMGASLFPWGVRPIVAWVVGFFSIGIAKLSFNLMAGLAAFYALNDFSGDQNSLYTLFGLFAPMFASGIAAGGGLAVWQAITGAAETTTTVVSKAVDLVI